MFPLLTVRDAHFDRKEKIKRATIMCSESDIKKRQSYPCSLPQHRRTVVAAAAATLVVVVVVVVS